MSEEKQIIAEDRESDYSHIPTNKPRELVHADEAIMHLTGRTLVGIAKLIKFQWDTPEEGGSTVTVVMKDINGGMNTFKGHGPTLGHALREMLDHVHALYPLGGEYEGVES